LGVKNADVYPQIVFVIIISTVIITTIGLGSAKKLGSKDTLASKA